MVAKALLCDGKRFLSAFLTYCYVVAKALLCDGKIFMSAFYHVAVVEDGF